MQDNPKGGELDAVGAAKIICGRGRKVETLRSGRDEEEPVPLR